MQSVRIPDGPNGGLRAGDGSTRSIQVQKSASGKLEITLAMAADCGRVTVDS
ncbi:MAG: hypothetical protein ACLPHI_07905 [Terriglobales bacterium]